MNDPRRRAMDCSQIKPLITCVGLSSSTATRTLVHHVRLTVLRAGLAVIFLAVSGATANGSFIDSATFMPISADLDKGGSSGVFRVIIELEISPADVARQLIRFHIADDAPGSNFNDRLIEVELQCDDPPLLLVAMTKITVDMTFQLKCSSTCELMGDGIVSVTLIDPANNQVICTGTGAGAGVNRTSFLVNPHRVVIEDIDLANNVGLLEVNCVTPVTAAFIEDNPCGRLAALLLPLLVTSMIGMKIGRPRSRRRDL